ncbi:PREDICTED: coiled-coil domain-containing protein 169-like, partial [Buceros rhinoceros silvestris]|uniref:coiled-coil domain-containing protein 169-like n=1 Tax=Buceros rhinoceros silvestris TaxID=175836 RepID=UPI000528E5E6
MLEISIFELRNTVTELEKRLSTVEEEGNEWKTRYETQVELNKQLERQINILQDKMELIHGNPADKLSSVHTFDQMPVVSTMAFSWLTTNSISPLMNMTGQLVTTDKEKTEVHNSFFTSVFTDNLSSHTPKVDGRQ